MRIATGAVRYQKIWTNCDITWPDLVQRLGKTKRTSETTKAYKDMPKDQQDSIKDVGGFVGGYLEGGSRKRVKNRSVITLDADNMQATDLEKVLAQIEILGYDAAVYSTHKHNAIQPRIRVVLPLAEEVKAEAYEPVARKVAEAIDASMMIFDDTTYEPGRVMYWPSTSKDGEFVFKEFKGSPISAPEILALYRDWHDMGSWPRSARAAEKMHKAVEKAQDPLTKEGVIGAFCRAYSIHEAIDKWVSDYKPSKMPGRYTYTKGSTSGGVVTYNDKFSYSHHATDPAGGQLCNAFDLVRIHMFQDLDKEVSEGVKQGARPSFKAMTNLALEDDKVKVEMIAEDFEEEKDEANEKDKSGWTHKLTFNKQGKPEPTYRNILLILQNDVRLKGAWGYNDLSKSEVALHDLPWRKVRKGEEALTDTDDANLRIYLEGKYKIQGKDKILDAVASECARHPFHPIKNYLESLEWDGVPRLDTMLVDYFGAEDSPYVRAVSRKTLLAAVTRIYEPGAHFDTMLTLKGPQGCGKSSFFRKLSKGWFTDSLKDIRNKDALEGLQGVWIVEMGELTAMKKADAESIKSFLSGTVDRFRMAYGRRTKSYPRQCIFVATTNEAEFLRDKTGNRRFWIVSASKGQKPKKDVFAITDNDIDQLWAEAKTLYDLGVDTLYLDQELEQEAYKVQESFMMEDPKAAMILSYLERKLPEGWKDMDLYQRQDWLSTSEEGEIERTKVCAAEIWCEALGYPDTKKMGIFEASDINKILDNLPEWERAKSVLHFGFYGKQRAFKKVKVETRVETK